MKILFINLPYFGHVVPTIGLVQELIKNAYAVAEQLIEAYDMVIYEQFFFLGKHLAEKYQKPVVRIFTAPVANKVLMQEYTGTKEHLKETVCSVMTDIEIKNNLHRIGEQIRRAPGNSGGAEKIIKYYEGKV